MSKKRHLNSYFVTQKNILIKNFMVTTFFQKKYFSNHYALKPIFRGLFQKKLLGFQFWTFLKMSIFENDPDFFLRILQQYILLKLLKERNIYCKTT